jgi:hypothetical protein
MNFNFSVSIILLLFLAACQQQMDESALLLQLQGGKCTWLNRKRVNLLAEKPVVDCYPVAFYSSFFVDHYKENCLISGATCLLGLPAISPQAVSALETFLLTGPNDVNTGDGTKSVRGTVAMAYARLAGPEALSILEKAYNRNDPLGVGSQASGVGDPSQWPGTARSNKEIEAAIKFLQEKRAP